MRPIWRVFYFRMLAKHSTLSLLRFGASLKICFHDYWKNIYDRWQMDALSTFFELPLERDLYKPKEPLRCDKPALRILITEAGSKVAQLLMYKICSGQVFGPDQPVIIHLVNAKGCVNHKSTILDLQECGFPVLEDSVSSSEPETTYKDVDVIVLIAPCEELSGHTLYNSLLCQLNKVRNVARNMRMYAKPDTKLVVCCPSTKGAVALLTCIRMFEPRIDARNLTCVVFLDEVVAKNLIAAQLKTTTDSIKNVTIWGGVTADLRNATVLTYPPDDKACLEKKEISIQEVLENQKWIYSDFLPNIFTRNLGPELIRHGAALATATAKHLKLLIQGSNCLDEIASMGVIVPPDEPFGFTKDFGFSLPVETKNGCVRIREDVDYDVNTHLMNLRAVYDVENNTAMKEIYKMVHFILKYEKTTKKMFFWNNHTHLGKETQDLHQHLKYYVTPNHEDTTHVEGRSVTMKTSITADRLPPYRKGKSSLRFNLERINYQ